ncbi:MAG: hypothetical protein ACE5R6_15155 [Candidatus Heimdallarchaeota archaeon]
MVSVSNASPLIYLAQLPKLKLLRKLFSSILIASEVLEEILRGKELGHSEVIGIEEEVGGLLNVVQLKTEAQAWREKVLATKGLHKGEASMLALAKQESSEYVLVDDQIAYNAAKALDFSPLRTPALLLKMAYKKLISLEELDLLLTELARAGFWITAPVHRILMQEARKHLETQ